MSEATPGAEHRINSFSDIAELYAKLPHERGELFLKETCEAARHYAATIRTAQALDPNAEIELNGFTWIDDDLRNYSASATFIADDQRTIHVKVTGNLLVGGDATAGEA